MEKKMPTGNYDWYKLVKDTKEYSVKFAECQNKWFFQKIIVPSDSECGIINNGLESRVSQLAWYAQLSDSTSPEEKNFLTAYGNFKAQCQTSEARSDGSGVYMALGGGASLLCAPIWARGDGAADPRGSASNGKTWRCRPAALEY